MVSFVCNSCQETLKKPKLDQHVKRCRYASFSCVDCQRDFHGTEYREHTSCITEAEKYQGALYRPKKSYPQQQQQQQQKQKQQPKAPQKPDVEATPAPTEKPASLSTTAHKILKSSPKVSLKKFAKQLKKLAGDKSTKRLQLRYDPQTRTITLE